MRKLETIIALGLVFRRFRPAICNSRLEAGAIGVSSASPQLDASFPMAACSPRSAQRRVQDSRHSFALWTRASQPLRPARNEPGGELQGRQTRALRRKGACRETLEDVR
eukprot:2787543-Pleurochrysis_carterae.AAC.1